MNEMIKKQAIRIQGLPAFDDNYLWLLNNEAGQAVVIDPGDAQVVQQALVKEQLQLEAILLTHHHFDHIGGVAELIQAQPNSSPLRVIGPDSSNIPMVTEVAEEGGTVSALGVDWRVLAVPGHTLDHIAYFSDDSLLGSAPTLFCGDTLFAAGCGRMFEGTAAMMWASLEKLRKLPANTRCYCAHEYTESNIRFALAVEPDNAELIARADQVQRQRARQEATVPSILAEELATNPFLRCDVDTVVEAAARHSQQAHQAQHADAVFGTIRQWKDHF